MNQNEQERETHTQKNIRATQIGRGGLGWFRAKRKETAQREMQIWNMKMKMGVIKVMYDASAESLMLRAAYVCIYV